MRHRHVGPSDRLCPGCYDEMAQILAEEAVARRRWGLILFGFVGALVVVLVLVLALMGVPKL